MHLNSVFLVFLVWIRISAALDCSQASTDTPIFDGYKVYIPGPTEELQPLPANFNCVYRITSPKQFSATVTLWNGIRGVNDYIYVLTQEGIAETHNNRTGIGGAPVEYVVVPGAEMSIQVITKSVFMNSTFSIMIEFTSAVIGPTLQMKTGSEMNYFDLSALQDGQDKTFKTVTFTGTTQIHMLRVNSSDDCQNYYIIDGTIDNHTAVYRRSRCGDLRFDGLGSTSITIMTRSNQFFGFVLNTPEEWLEYNIVSLINAVQNEDTIFSFPDNGTRQAMEVVNFNSIGIIFQAKTIWSMICEAYLVSGPPNNASTVILKVEDSEPHYFDLKYLTVIQNNCDFDFNLRAYNN
uniref:CUB_2 domain-containing protein n=1 Tax=Caenorhabditis tropicalis TaxID=1561998 RepID=A0A1I7TH52_9PELO